MDKKKNGKCLHCGKAFKQNRRDKKFCSSLCRIHDWDKKHPRVSIDKLQQGSPASA